MTYSIIIPTYNSDLWIKDCINSVLSQTFGGFNIIIIDSGSTDGTLSWIRSLNDKRILIYPTEKRLSISDNWARITGIPKNEFMTILGHDDILHPNYLERIESLRMEHPFAGLYQTHFNFIDETGAVIKPCKPMAVSITAPVLLEKVMQNEIVIVVTGFMVRSFDYDTMGGIPLYPNLLYADISLWLNTVKKSYLAVAPEICFGFRFHLNNTSKIADVSRLLAFEKMIHFFGELRKEGTIFKTVIDSNAKAFLKSYVTGACNKLIYIAKQHRNTLTMDNIIGSSKKCAAELLKPGEDFEPSKFPAVMLAKFIDSNTLLRRLFLYYKSFSKRTF